MFSNLGRILAGALFLFTIGMTTDANAQRGRLVLLAKADAPINQDTITIDTRGARGAFNALRVYNKGDRILIDNVRIMYSDGSVHDERRPINLLRGERTRPADPRRGHKFVDTVIISYNKVEGSSDVAKIEIWGHQTNAGRRMKRTGNAVATNNPAVAKPKAEAAVPNSRHVLFGAQYVAFDQDKAVIDVDNEVGKFERIHFRVLDNLISVTGANVVYASGDAQAIEFSGTVTKGTRSKWFKVNNARFINQVEIAYEAKPEFKGKARIEVFGDYAKGWLGADGEGRKYNDGWVLLGAQTADFLGFDTDVIPVGSNDGGFKKIRVIVRDRAITLNELRVVYANTKADIIPIKTRVDAGSTYGPIELKGSVRSISEIQAKYRSRFVDKAARVKGKAIVEIWGKH